MLLNAVAISCGTPQWGIPYSRPLRSSLSAGFAYLSLCAILERVVRGVPEGTSRMADRDRFSDVAVAEARLEIPAVNLLWDILVRPVDTLSYLRDHPQRIWLAPVILAVLLVVAQGLVTIPIANRPSAERLDAQLAQMPAQGRAQIQARMVRGASLALLAATTLITGAIGLCVRWLFRAGAIHLFSLRLGGRNRFDQVFSMVVWTWVPLLVRSLLQTFNIAFSGTVPTHRGLAAYLAALGQPLPGGVQYTLLSEAQADLFALWNLMLLGAGVLIVSELSRVRALLATVSYWVLATALSPVPSLVGQLVLSRFPMLRGPGG